MAAALPAAAVDTPADHATAETTQDTSVYSCADIDGLCVTASTRSSLRIVDRWTRTDGRLVLCVWWYPRERGWESDLPVAPARHPIPGYLYVLDCFYSVKGNPRVVGFPRLELFDGTVSRSGVLVTEREVAEHSLNRLGLERPIPVLAPPRRQLVGVETWLAVVSRLHYRAVKAQAGPIWAEVRVEFDNVTWDFGELRLLLCRRDASKLWDPSRSGRQQSSACTRVFSHISPAGGSSATVTVNWRVYQRSNEHVDWHYHSNYSLTTALRLEIAELQAVIR